MAVIMTSMMNIHERSDDGWSPRPPPSVNAPIIRSVHGAYHAVTRRLDAATRQHGLDASEALVLAQLLRDPGCAGAVVRHRLEFHRSTLSSLLDRLEGDGLLERRSLPFDRRRVELLLTRAGAIAAEIAELVIAEIEAELAIYTSLPERRAAHAVFEACVAIGHPDRRSTG